MYLLAELVAIFIQFLILLPILIIVAVAFAKLSEYLERRYNK